MDSSHLLNSLADASVRSLCLAIAAMIAIAVVRTRSAPVKHAVWTAVVCAMLALPVLSVALPAIPLRVLAPAATSVEPLPELVSGPQAAGPVTVKPAPERSPAGFGWPEFAAFAYAVIAVVLIGKLALGYLLSARLVRRSAPIEGAPIEVRSGALAESAAISVPLTVGWRRPHILFPAGWREWDRTKLAAVLAHEAAHVARRDWLVAALARLNTSIFWFHPLAWWMERKLAALAEEACDELSLAATGNRERYAEVLLEMADAVRKADGRIAWHAVTMARRSQVRQRVEAILDESRRLSRGMTKARWAAVLLCAVPLAYGAAALRFEQAQAPAQSEAKTPWPEGSYMDALSRGNRITPAEAQRLEGYLQANPEDLAARGSLISYYFLNAIREPRLKHIFWLIEHHPESEIAGFNSTGISPRVLLLNSESDYNRARDLWLEQVRTHGNDARVLGNAARFFLQPGADIATAADLLKRVAPLDPRGGWTTRLSTLYVNVIVGALRPRNPRFMEFPDETALAGRFKAELENSTDGALLSSVGWNLTRLARDGDNPDLAPAAELGERLMKRASELGAPVPSQAIVRAGVPGGVRGGISGGVQGGVLRGVPITPPPPPPPPPFVKNVMPEYPLLAKQARVQGTVTFVVRVGKDGNLQATNMVSGHPLLVPAASDALKQWVFRPWLVDGQPVEATFTIGMIFTLPPDGQGDGKVSLHVRQGAEPQGANLVPPSPPLPPNGRAPEVIERVPPVYPPLAKQARIQGTVRLRAEIGTDGKVVRLTLVGGHPLLVTAAQEALQQWKFKPAEVNGQPIQAATTVDVNFTLPPGETPTSINVAQPQRIRVGGNVQMANLIEKVDPVYPPAGARGAHTGHGAVQHHHRPRRTYERYPARIRPPAARAGRAGGRAAVGLQAHAAERCAGRSRDAG